MTIKAMRSSPFETRKWDREGTQKHMLGVILHATAMLSMLVRVVLALEKIRDEVAVFLFCSEADPIPKIACSCGTKIPAFFAVADDDPYLLTVPPSE
jgi:hypothetical protein